MLPSDRPTNDNRGPREPVVLSPRGKRIELAVSIVGLIAIPIFMLAVLDGAHWQAFGITMGVALVCMIVAAIYRLIVHGRA